MATDIFLALGAKKVGRHKSSQINGLCLEAPAPSTEKWRFCPSKNRHFRHFFLAMGAGTGSLLGRAFQPDIPGNKNVRLESLTYAKNVRLESLTYAKRVCHFLPLFPSRPLCSLASRLRLLTFRLADR